MDLLTDGINKAKQESNPDVIEMFEFFLKVIEKNKAVEKALAMRSGKHESSLATTQPPLPPQDMDTETVKKAGGGHEGVAAESRLVQGEASSRVRGGRVVTNRGDAACCGV